MNHHEKINYVEFPSSNIAKTKTFFEQVFEWVFTDYGPDYTAFHNAGLEGGFFASEKRSSTQNGGALVVFYSENLESTETKIILHGGEIVVKTFSFPGGKRFHFQDPVGNEFAVWSDK